MSEAVFGTSLWKVRLGRPNRKPLPAFNFYIRREKKKISTQNCTHYNASLPDFQFSFSFIKK